MSTSTKEIVLPSGYTRQCAQEYLEFVQRASRLHGGKLDLSDIQAVDPELLKHFRGARIEVEGDNYVRRGRVGVTMGWKPSLLLMHRTSDIGSSDVLGPNDRLVRVVAL